jgi:hypothetical protein
VRALDPEIKDTIWQAIEELVPLPAGRVHPAVIVSR